MGLGIYSWHLRFFTNIFSWAALILWLILAFWIGLFMMLASHYQRRRPIPFQCFLLTAAWMALEYFRGELYFLKFTWATPGLAFTNLPGMSSLGMLGVYGMGGLCLFLAATSLFFPRKAQVIWVIFLTFLLGGFVHWKVPTISEPTSHRGQIQVGGLHLENPGSSWGLEKLDQFMGKHPDTDLLLLAEYSFFGPPPAALLHWCQSNQVYMIIGGTRPLENDSYYNTAFVISPEGKVVFEQAKSVPIQFFRDGLPAPHQKVWQSPWGPMGICICYDLSYTRVTDELIKQGAEMILVPTLDELHWGESQHRLHARIAPMRAAEYGVPILRVGACGISQAVRDDGSVQANTEFPGEHATISALISPSQESRIPWDRYLVWVCFAVTGIDLIKHLVKRKQKEKSQGKGQFSESYRADSR